jgi:hypothetical protein
MANPRALSLFGGLLLWPLALCLCAWVYWPGLAGPALLDDSANLRPLQLLEEQPDLITDVVAGNLSGPLGRPVSMLSFSLEQVYLGGGVSSQKRVNLYLHLIIASLLLFFCRDVFTQLQQPRPLFLAMAAASLWLLAPLLLSTILYSIQRMAQLSTLFTVLALTGYLRCRVSRGWLQVGWGLLAAASLLAAPLSKENGLLALPLVLWLEWTVLRFDGFGELARRRWVRIHVTLVSLAVLLFAALWILRPEYVVGAYARRDFDLLERLLTQARVLWTYVGQLLWVDRALLGLYQDDQLISRGILQPVSTLGAVLGWLAVAASTLLFARRRATGGIAFGLGFFMLAHTMESTIFPLEMYFEHRNYLPAAGLLVALLSAIGWLIARLPWCVNWLVLAWFVLFSHALMATAAEAQLWSHNYLLHITAVNRFPNSLRANIEMSRVMALGGDLQQALRYASRAEQLETQAGLRQQLRRVNLHCLAGPAIAPQVIDELTATAEDFRDHKVSELVHLLVKNIVDGGCPETDINALGDHLQRLTLATDPHAVSPMLYVSMAILENHAQRYEHALAHINALLARSPDSVRALMMKLYFTSVLELHAEHRAVLLILQDMQSRGLLNRQQEYNVSLFTPVDQASAE